MITCVSTCKMDKKVWDRLSVMYEVMSEDKNLRLNILLHNNEYL